MAYFSNGSEGMIFNQECAECVFADEACPVAVVQTFYNYDAVNNEVASKILNGLVEQNENGGYAGCQMKPLLEELKVRNNEQTKKALKDRPCQADFDALVFERNMLKAQLSSEIEKRIALEDKKKGGG